VDDSPVIESMSYRQARAFSRLGAGVLHHDSIAPVERLAIPIYIKNTFKPSAPGTRISPFAHSHLPFLAMTKCAAGMCRLTLIGADARCADAVTSHMPPEAAVTRAGDTIAIVCPEYHAKAAARAAFEVCWRIARRA
jgi:aspartokinase